MPNKLFLTIGGIHKVGKKAYLTVGGVHRKIKKAYLTTSGVHRLCFSGDVDVAAMAISYSASNGMTDAGIVTMGDGNQYRLLIVTKSGTLAVDEEVQAEIWMCGGGTSGQEGQGGGAGAFTNTGTVTLSGNMAAVIGAGGAKATSSSLGGRDFLSGGATSFCGLQTSTAFSLRSSKYHEGVCGGTGGGASGSYDEFGTGDGKTKYPFADTTYFSGKPHCGGGGGGSYSRSDDYDACGGDGGTNGGNGGSYYPDVTGTASGGSYGGGAGGCGSPLSAGSSATYYGSGGGGGGRYYNVSQYSISNANGGAGYQGVIYIRIPVRQAS